MSKGTNGGANDTNNGAGDEPAIVRLRPTSDPLPTPTVELPIKLRREEALPDLIVRLGRHADLSLVLPDASLSASQKEACARQWLELAEADEFFRRTSKAQMLLAARAAWHLMNPQPQGDLGAAAERGRDILGRALSGPARSISLLLARVVAEPRCALELTDVEHELVRSHAPALGEAIERLKQSTAQGLQAIEEAAASDQENYPGGEPLAFEVVREPAEATS